MSRPQGARDANEPLRRRRDHKKKKQQKGLNATIFLLFKEKKNVWNIYFYNCKIDWGKMGGVNHSKIKSRSINIKRFWDFC